MIKPISVIHLYFGYDAFAILCVYVMDIHDERYMSLTYLHISVSIRF